MALGTMAGIAMRETWERDYSEEKAGSSLPFMALKRQERNNQVMLAMALTQFLLTTLSPL